MKVSLLINMKMPTVVDMFLLISRENFMHENLSVINTIMLAFSYSLAEKKSCSAELRMNKF